MSTRMKMYKPKKTKKTRASIVNPDFRAIKKECEFTLLNRKIQQYLQAQMESNEDLTKLPGISRGNLALHNGTDKPQIWVAYKGIVYDVTVSRLWKNGKHYEHWAGQDLTAELEDAPHAAWVFDKFDPVAKLLE